jgi:thioredoxin 1
MALCCIGGVCVPYSAVVPLLLLCLRWLLQKAVELGLLPKSVQERLFPATSSKYAPAPADCSNEPCCTGEGDIVAVESEDSFRELLKKPYVVCKFTASWCRPCQEIHPEFVSLSQQHASTAVFCTVDVDDLEEVASEYKVAMMPTFLVFRNGHLKETKTGIDLLEAFVSRALQEG